MAQFVNSRVAVLLLVASLAVLASAAPKPSDWHVCGAFSGSQNLLASSRWFIARVSSAELTGRLFGLGL